MTKTKINQESKGLDAPIVRCSFSFPITVEIYDIAKEIIGAYHKNNNAEESILLSDLKSKMHKSLYKALLTYFALVEQIKNPTIKDMSKLSMSMFKTGRGNGRMMCLRLKDFCEDNGIRILP